MSTRSEEAALASIGAAARELRLPTIRAEVARLAEIAGACEWSLSLSAEHHPALSTIRSYHCYHCGLRLFSEYLCDGRYGWIAACQKEFGPQVHPVR